MKIKLSPITNSSSSSFIVAFDKKITSLDEIKDKIMFIEKASQVFHDIQKQSPILLDSNDWICIHKIADELNSGTVYLSDGVRKDKKDSESDIAKSFVKDNEGKVAYFFEYSDNDSEFFSEMEHGDTFRQFKHLVTSHH